MAYSKRKRLHKGKSKRLFRKTAGGKHSHPKNHRSGPMRGGIRL